MKLKLVVASGVHEGREIPIATPEFMIGRDPQCQLRPASPAISKRHCAIIQRGGKVYVRDYGSTNGTFINGAAVQGEIEVNDQATLKVGPLDFRIAIAAPPAPVAAATPKKAPAKVEDDDQFAAFLLEGDSGPGDATPGAIPDGSTIMEVGGLNPPGAEGEKKEAAKPDPKKDQGDTRSAAAEILRQYQRRPRS